MLEASSIHLDEMGGDVSELLIRELKLPVYGIENIADRLRGISIRNRGHERLGQGVRQVVIQDHITPGCHRGVP
jgi:hypothetical protein